MLKQITKVALSRYFNFPDNITLPVNSVQPNSPLVVTNIDGLGPPDFNVNVGALVNQSDFYVGSSDIKRQLTFTIALNPNYAIGQTVADLRQAFYKYLGYSGSTRVNVRLYDSDNNQYNIGGAISKLTPNPFSKDPQIQLIVNCFDSTFSSPNITTNNNPTEPMHGVQYDGSAPAGFELDVVFNGVQNSFQMTVAGDGSLESISAGINISYTFQPNDQLRIITMPGRRGVWVLPAAGGTTSILPYAYIQQRDWPMLVPGSNYFSYAASPGLSVASSQLLYWKQYWGV